MATTIEPEDDLDDDELTDEEEDEIERRLQASLVSEREGRLIPWEALFPPKRAAG
jgi:hypothetical protein